MNSPKKFSAPERSYANLNASGLPVTPRDTSGLTGEPLPTKLVEILDVFFCRRLWSSRYPRLVA